MFSRTTTVNQHQALLLHIRPLPELPEREAQYVYRSLADDWSVVFGNHRVKDAPQTEVRPGIYLFMLNGADADKIKDFQKTADGRPERFGIFEQAFTCYEIPDEILQHCITSQQVPVIACLNPECRYYDVMPHPLALQAKEAKRIKCTCGSIIPVSKHEVRAIIDPKLVLRNIQMYGTSIAQWGNNPPDATELKI